ncbi:2-dehydro-3-deoxygluconokinase [Rhodobacter aestuarii]|uniref:2-dehydro-3-deoxygluconokinase n=1 Tax=Rhodobacter aestuarii TaxID=453582 RepID=A0A1N7PKC4_9RHOB|nr:sugar kinase [Rhodobacter aestuarii]PTV94348.1 2-dehydro-3-deoxygluconokinase [Rhodobacter aestuarii]SIT11075.1 2-dehydro-3-deoxygluconokinase [Rhodobacter aestuarii]
MKIACVGEAMIELNPDRAGAQIGYAGDTLNTAIYLARGFPQAQVEFVTVLGSDAMSARMEAFIRSEGVGTSCITHHADRLPGVYVIATDAAGERSFSYWRNQSAARTLFEDGFAQLEGMDVIYLSAITLAILPPDVRAHLIEHLAQHQATVVFDSNYRPRLWENETTARKTISAAWEVTDIALPSVDDEMALGGESDPVEVLKRFRAAGFTEGALKCGAAGAMPFDATVTAPPYAPAPRVVDTTAAGDSFNGAYLAAVLQGASEAEALGRAHLQACAVIAQPGAIIPR